MACNQSFNHRRTGAFGRWDDAAQDEMVVAQHKSAYNAVIACTAGALAMATMTIRNLDEDLKARLRVRAARHGQSMEEEVRSILRSALQAEPLSGKSFVKGIREMVEPYGGIELELPVRHPQRDPPDFR